MDQMIRILGVDPGLRHTGWGVIAMDGPRLTWIAHGVIKPDTDADMADRLAELCVQLRAVVELHAPNEAAIEETFVNVNPRSTLLLGQARGAAMATLAGAGLKVAEFAATKVKQSVVGTGAADKTQVAFMVRRLLPKAGEVKADAADALAVAICGAHHRPLPPQKLAQQRQKA
jgi:crossover junction endodeoxyribonuclease RuvC